MSILLTGGAGYIGAITNNYLKNHGIDTVVFDNLSTGHLESIPKTPFVQGDLKNKNDIENVFKHHKIDGVIHFGALALAGESMQIPDQYYENNVMGTVNLLEVMKKFGCKKIVFSSSCSVFGTPTSLPVTEKAQYHPESVYAETKKMCEEVLHRYDEIFGIKSVILRYFNASGATPDEKLGENHVHETHIIPNLLEIAKNGSRSFTLFGNDYDTPDGSCIRDYIHVVDLAKAHFLALKYLDNTSKSNDFNLGSGKGISNLELLKVVEQITKKSISITINPRRPGDPSAIFADPTKAREMLHWQPEFSDIETIIETAWKWHTR